MKSPIILLILLSSSLISSITSPTTTATATATTTATPPPPNILLIMCDDLGWGDVRLQWQHNNPDTQSGPAGAARYHLLPILLCLFGLLPDPRKCHHGPQFHTGWGSTMPIPAI